MKPEEVLTEAVEVCPFCERENVFVNWDVEKRGYIAKCWQCGHLKQHCIECESHSCQFNHGGECRFALVHERKPRINDVDGCIDYDYQEGES